MGERKNILLVGEDRLLGELVKASMESAELGVHLAGTPDLAEQEITLGEPDLILVDSGLPGWEPLAGRWSRERPVVAIVASDAMRRAAEGAGLDPLDRRRGLHDLIEILRRRLALAGLPQISDRHILIVDDDAKIREVMATFISGRGYTVTVASDGREGLERILKPPPLSVVFLDINMPKMGGLSVLAEIRKLRESPDVIVMSGIADQEVAHRAMELGAFDYILKPPDPARVEAAISACVSHHQYRGKTLWSRLRDWTRGIS